MRRRMLASLGGAKLPYDHELEWIECVSGAIDTGLYGTDNLLIDLYFSIPVYYGPTIFGVRTAYGNKMYNVNHQSSGNCGWGNKSSSNQNFTSFKGIAHWYCNSNEMRIVYPNRTLTAARPASFTTDYTIKIIGHNFGTSSVGTSKGLIVHGRVYFRDTDGNVIAEFIPCLKDGVIGYWETVKREFHGDIRGVDEPFIAGPKL